MRELVDNRTSWHRSLWQVGTVLTIEEIVEATRATWSGSITTDQALKDLCQAAKTTIPRDPGLGTTEVRSLICDAISAIPPKQTAEGEVRLAELQQHAARARASYLLNWRDLLHRGDLAQDEIEVSARLTAAHLLDEGFHRAHVHGWLQNTGEATLADVMDEGHGMLQSDERNFELLLAVRSVDGNLRPALATYEVPVEEFLQSFDAASKNGETYGTRPPSAAIKLTFEARDPHAAVGLALTWAQRVENRAEVGKGAPSIEFDNRVVDTTTRRIRTLRESAKPVTLPTLGYNSNFLTQSIDSPLQARVDDAVGMLASRTLRAAPTGIATTWASVEALLGLPRGKGVESADRLADIVTCSFPRAEFWEITRRWERVGEDDFAKEIAGLESNSEKTEAMVAKILTGYVPGFDAPKEQAALNRVRQLLDGPAAVLGRIRSYYVSTFRRLYYQRNFIMHAGKLDSVSLEATSRTAPPLVAAGLDRIVNASLTSGVEPLSLAARAGIELQLVGTRGSRQLHNLLR